MNWDRRSARSSAQRGVMPPLITSSWLLSSKETLNDTSLRPVPSIQLARSLQRFAAKRPFGRPPLARAPSGLVVQCEIGHQRDALAPADLEAELRLVVGRQLHQAEPRAGRRAGHDLARQALGRIA